jgi:hypothetical protein
MVWPPAKTCVVPFGPWNVQPEAGAVKVKLPPMSRSWSRSDEHWTLFRLPDAICRCR